MLYVHEVNFRWMFQPIVPGSCICFRCVYNYYL